MKVSTQNVLLLFWTICCTALLFCIAVFHIGSRDIGLSTLATSPTSQEALQLLMATGSGSIQSVVSNELDYMHALLIHIEKGLLFAEYVYGSTENAEVMFLADNLTRRFRYTSLNIRKWLQDWYNEDPSLLSQASIPFPKDLSLSEADSLFLDFMLRHNSWESALTKQALRKGIRQELAEHVLKNDQVSALELDVINHLRK